MVDTKVETIARLAQWKVENFGPTLAYKRSEPFKIGIWNWHLSVEKNRSVYIRLFPEPSRVSKDQPPIARFVLRVTTAGSNRRPYISPIHERLLRTSDDFACPVDVNFQGRFVIDVEFLDLRICGANLSFSPFLYKSPTPMLRCHSFEASCSQCIYTSNIVNRDSKLLVDLSFSLLIFYSSFGCPRPVKFKGGEGSSIWPSDGMMQYLTTQSTLRCLSRMLDEAIYSDVTINTCDGTLQAHKAILSASSPVFLSMFQHNLKEKESSTIDIEDMTSQSCMALLSYLYGTISQEDFWKHRLALLGAANKYDIVDLKDACEESLLEDINTGNVLERLQEAWLYQLNKLKKGCMMYLLDFGKIYDVRDEMNEFFRHADRELAVEMFQELLAVWKPA